VVHFTSEDPDYPAAQLNNIVPSTKGWQSVRFPTYPQELIFELVEGDAKITKIQVLSHQSKIAKKIDIFIGTGNDFENAQWKRLGYLSLDCNERSSYQARELKTVFIDNIGRFMKFIINECYSNKINTHNQVGIVAVSLLGEELASSKDDYSRGSDVKRSSYKNVYNDLTVDLTLDPQTANKLRQLADAKSRAIANEDYSTAKQIKSVEQELKALGSRLAQLNMAKSEAVDAEDYDLAKEIKDESDSLKLEIERKIRSIQVPGVAPMTTHRSPRDAPGKNDNYESEINTFKHASASEPTSSGRRVVSVEPMDSHEDTLVGRGSNNPTPSRNNPVFVEEESIDVMNRPIMPKELDYAAAAAAATGGDDGDADPLASTGMPTEMFPSGQHPLEGVPNLAALPTPEQLTMKSREYCDQTGITKVFGEYRARCLHSKVWALREAAISKIMMILSTEYEGDANWYLSAICGVLRIGAEDKIQQVLFNSLNLMEQFLDILKRERLPRSTTSPAFDGVVGQLIEKLSDSNSRLREGARKGLDILAASTAVGPGAIAYHAAKSLTPKQRSAWRPIASRIQLIADLVNAYGLGQSSGLNMDSLLNFSKSNGAYAHSNVEVRDAAKDLVVAIQRHVGTTPLEATLSSLRKKQREEYEAAFEAAATNSGGAGGQKKPAVGQSAGSSKRTDMSQQHSTHNPGGKVPTSSSRTQEKSQGYNSPPQRGHHTEDEAKGQDFSTCMFCGMSNPQWAESELDLHYWKDCPLLISCPSCAQIVEIAGLPEHLLDECDSKSNYVPCDITGLAIRKNEYDSWRKSSQCRPAPDNSMYCPLCYTAVDDSDEAWQHHLTVECPKNGRTKTGGR
jgi:centrosomal protein CEP104